MDLLPSKHVHLNETLIGLGAVVLNELRAAKTPDDLWEAIKELKRRRKFVPEKISFEDLILVIDCLYALQTIRANEKGELIRCG